VEPQHATADGDAVFRDEIKEGHKDYFVVYQPADDRITFATVSISFPGEVPEASIVRTLMERELEHWLARYPVPVMVSAFDAADNLTHPCEEPDGSHLIGYVNTVTGGITRHWRLVKDDELPPDQRETSYLARVYSDVPFRHKEQVRKDALAEAQTRARVIRFISLIMLFMVAVPVLIEVVAWGVTWLGHVLAGISVIAGAYRAAKARGWIEPSPREKADAEKKRRMEHYFYHCERNPRGFESLKNENFERETIARTQKEAAELRPES
jgi:hypothetical protein